MLEVRLYEENAVTLWSLWKRCQLRLHYFLASWTSISSEDHFYASTTTATANSHCTKTASISGEHKRFNLSSDTGVFFYSVLISEVRRDRLKVGSTTSM